MASKPETTKPKRDRFWRGVPRPVRAWATLTREGEILVASVRERSEDVKLACGECVPFRVVITFEPVCASAAFAIDRWRP